jgi:hypothetical protein
MEASIMRLWKEFEPTFLWICWENIIFKIWIWVDKLFYPLYHAWTFLFCILPLGLSFYELISTWHMYFNVRIQKKTPPLYTLEAKFYILQLVSCNYTCLMQFFSNACDKCGCIRQVAKEIFSTSHSLWNEISKKNIWVKSFSCTLLAIELQLPKFFCHMLCVWF